jgi:hypothetical protein
MSLEAIGKLRNKNHQETKERRAKGIGDVMSTPGHRISLNQTLVNWRYTQEREQNV